MAYTYTLRDGQRVETNVAAAFDKLASAFEKQFRLKLLVTSGTRTRAEQQRLYDLYRAGKGNLAAVPGTSNHEEGGPRGPRAIDVRDSGKDWGVTRAGTVRSNWLRANAPKYGFDPAGFRFSQIEPWHIEYTGALYTPPKPAPAPAPAPSTKNPLQGWDVRGVQAMLRRHWGYKGGVDNVFGAGSIAALQRFLNANGHNAGAADGIWGPNTAKATQRWLKARWGYRGAIDGIFGAGTKNAWVKANAENWRVFK